VHVPVDCFFSHGPITLYHPVVNIQSSDHNGDLTEFEFLGSNYALVKEDSIMFSKQGRICY
jgi:hypothetical protein